MNRKTWERAWWAILAFVVLAVVAFGIAICPLSDAGSEVQTPTAAKTNPGLDTGVGGSGNQEYDWEWQEDQDPSMLGRPTYLR